MVVSRLFDFRCDAFRCTRPHVNAHRKCASDAARWIWDRAWDGTLIRGDDEFREWGPRLSPFTLSLFLLLSTYLSLASRCVTFKHPPWFSSRPRAAVHVCTTNSSLIPGIRSVYRAYSAHFALAECLSRYSRVFSVTRLQFPCKRHVTKSSMCSDRKLVSEIEKKRKREREHWNWNWNHRRNAEWKRVLLIFRNAYVSKISFLPKVAGIIFVSPLPFHTILLYTDRHNSFNI